MARPSLVSRLAVLATVLAAAIPAGAQDPPAWPDTFPAHVEALALMQMLNAELLASRSATATLEAWCGVRRLAAPARIVADRVPRTSAPTADQLRRLEVTTPDEVKYRHVRLRCGTRVLAEADNWYVPARLTPDMNRTLETTDAPFGRVVAPLEPYRRTFAVTLLLSADALFAHRAILYTRDHRPFSEVAEIYQRAVLAPPLTREPF
jgi:chorismate-pyruvate lyase